FCVSSRRRHTRLVSDWSSDVCSSDLISGKANLAFEDLGHHRVKNIPEAIHVFRVPYEGAPSIQGTRRASAPQAQQPATASIAVQIGRASCRERVERAESGGAVKRK